MHIAVDGGTWMNGRGYGRFTREVLAAAASLPGPHRFTIVIDSSVPPDATPPIPAVRVRLRTPPDRAASAAGHRSIRDLYAMSRALAAQPADCVWFPSVYTYVPLATRRPIVVCIHDVIAERFPSYVFSTWRARLFWNLKAAAATRQATRIMTVSAHARDGIAEVFGLTPDTIRIVPEAPAASFRPDADIGPARAALAQIGLAVETSFVLYVGGIAPHKNLVALVDAFAALRRTPRFANLHLLMVGDYTDDVFYSAYRETRRHIEGAHIGGAVFTGRLADPVVAGLMRLAQACVLPSLDEGFGLPAIEAAACGAPVLATRNSAMPEVLGDAALYCDPSEEGGLERELRRLLSDESLRTLLGARAAARAQQYTWTSSARALLDVFDEVADSRPATTGM